MRKMESKRRRIEQLKIFSVLSLSLCSELVRWIARCRSRGGSKRVWLGLPIAIESLVTIGLGFNIVDGYGAELVLEFEFVFGAQLLGCSEQF
ncbi:hypothetical protein L6452_35244 [Arctium lappa]|uniref:Uncharacterized protein n=1 Tax=Arctium lappa TaxID=4217 RepID=A0ACB8Y737_ARCLA|nr:hypothetical protein L6452_35244 [Arctium lappa]